MPDAGMEQVFWQSESMLHVGAQPAFIPEEVEPVFPPVPTVALAPAPGFPPMLAPVVACPPTPAASIVWLPEAQATKMAALAEKRATRVTLAYFTLLRASLRLLLLFLNGVVRS
jgi:hypothetical protein